MIQFLRRMFRLGPPHLRGRKPMECGVGREARGWVSASEEEVWLFPDDRPAPPRDNAGREEIRRAEKLSQMSRQQPERTS